MNDKSSTPGIEVSAQSIEELNAWYTRRTMTGSVSGRNEYRNGQWFGLGGLDWMLTAPGVVVTLTTSEGEKLPALPVVLALRPGQMRANRLQGVAA